MNQSKTNKLLLAGAPGDVYFAAWLQEQGYQLSLLAHYRKLGLLFPLSRGVMYRPGSSLSAFTALASSNAQVGTHYRVAAHSALERFGISHFVSMGKAKTIVATPKGKVPAWMQSDLFETTIVPFSTETFTQPVTTTVQHNNQPLLISAPEQAILECLLLVNEHYSYLDVFYLMEQLTTLRPEVVQTLLENTHNYRVKRMFLYMAEKAAHLWFDDLDLSRIDLGSGKQQLAPEGVYIDKYKIVIPRDLYDYE